ncbi:unnamed protein product, partial [Mesorhabditis spiculigera]
MDVGLGLGPPRGPLGYEPDDGLPQADPLPDGWVEHRLQVDRKRLEAMITGNPLHGTGLYLQNADEFFRKVQEMSEAVVCWPSKLKIGAKTKKDPFVKILGLPHQVEVAAQLIAAKLQVKRDRVTLKMEIVHSAHSHIIGKGGRGSQTVMRHTGCHVHFPDGNKYSEDLTKSDQVSIAGPAAQVEQARRLLRDLCPVIIQLEVPYLAAHPPMFPPVTPTVNIMWKKISDCLLTCTLRGCAGNEADFQGALDSLLQMLHLPVDLYVCCRVLVEIRPVALKALYSSANMPRLVFEGTLKQDYTAIEACHAVSIQAKSRLGQGGEQVNFSIRAAEEQMVNVLRARQRILGQEQSETIDDDYDFMKITQNSEPIAPFSRSLVGRGNNSEESTRDAPLSPDPENSPIAHSLLTGAKHINGDSQLWSGQPSARRASREQMLFKAHQAISDTIGTSTRYPTDLWAGYGFSNSLPTDLLKGMIDLKMAAGADGANGHMAPGTSIKGLAAVREEEEDSSLSASSSSLSNTFSTRVFQKKQKLPAFSASTSIFESPLGASESAWDVSLFTEPAMVLAQLGLGEYTANLREQEIDMDAFLLLDEAALRDIGVATVGARKKIHHAILKLRESAKAQGYSL